jgi:hypothetical protein
MFWIKLSLIVVWFVAGLLLFANEVVKDFKFLKPVFVSLRLIGSKSVSKPTVVKKQAEPIQPPVQAKTMINQEPINVVKQEPAEETNALENVQIFKKKISARTSWYASLTETEKTEFRRYFVEDVDTHLVKELNYRLSGNNDAFFENVFRYIYVYRKLISRSLLEKLTDELLFFAEKDAETLTLIYEASARVAYFRRQDKAMLAYAETLARLDVALHQGELNTKNTYVYSFTRLAIILERKGQIKEALTLVEDALKRKLSDRTKTGYKGRQVRLQNQLGK